MRKKISFLSLLLSVICFAQTNPQSFNSVLDDWQRSAFKIDKSVVGSPYLTNEFQLSKVNDFPDQIQMRYNIYHDNIELLKDEKIMILPKEEIYSNISIGYGKDSKLILKEGGYFVLITNFKDIKILKKVKVKFQDFKKAKSSYEEDLPASFIRLDDQYFIFRDNKLENIPKNAKDFVELFPEKKNDLLKFIKEKKLKLNTDSGITDAVKFTEK